ncbi:DUF4345 family protein [Parasphingopyxis sp. CP4]|uniref:DUF4345 family protein n=1 Tax=Parasphingopyxis sp. CP4 TaxID=2724527 RepID=UPI0015A30535|nr:DUF4345 family protein [Parasphingopyxis sp. CP4]QLC21897.1 DUF4345 family protein [Parasphingopyxis sp. CP4]
MAILVRILVLLLGLFNIFLGISFLFNPAEMAGDFFLEPQGIQGLATIRADYPAFFLTAGGFALYSAWKQSGWPLLVPMCLMSIAIIGRVVSLALDGEAPTAFQPMVVEAIMIAISVIGYRVFGRSAHA